MTALHRLGSRLSAYVSAVVESPPLLGLVAGAWIAVLSLFTAANPVMAFLTVAPAVMILWYGVLYGARRLRGESFAESASQPATTRAGSVAARDEDVGDDRALVRLRERYADGEIDHEEFEERLEALLATEDVLSGAKSEASEKPSAIRER
jgi:hypothetical protein